MKDADFLQLVRIGAGTTLGGLLMLVLLAWLAQRAGLIEGSPGDLAAQALGVGGPVEGSGTMQLASAGSGSGCAYES